MKKNSFSRFNIAWYSVAVACTLATYGIMGITYKWWGYGISWWSLFMLAGLVVATTYPQKLGQKILLFTGVFIIIQVIFTAQALHVCSAGCWGVLEIFFIIPIQYVLYLSLILVQHFRNKIALVSLFLIVLVGLILACDTIQMRYRTYNNYDVINTEIKDGAYSNTEDALTKCQNIKRDSTALSICIATVAEHSNDPALCNEIPGDGVNLNDKEDRAAACISIIAQQTHQGALCADKQIIDDLTRDICLLGSGEIKTKTDCAKLSIPFQKQQCEATMGN